eukprot:TRINITY_DN460_c0_g1_i4.p1 TRINITY_DN460_c0_g1~~TRINITY_DN460_c0_g1_i4.p1  ORF type:complete len:329 (-),score=37.13 TRINITY_DN460_c0_g1_i4:1570-2556(-)
MEGYKTYTYVNEDLIDEDYTCIICCLPYLNPVTHSVCRNTFCSECLKQQKNCPICRGTLSKSDLMPPPRFIERLLGKLQVECNECSRIMNRSEFDSHTCYTHYENIYCKYGCGNSFPSYLIQRHEDSCRPPDLICSCPPEHSNSNHMSHCIYFRLGNLVDSLRNGIGILKEQCKLLETNLQDLNKMVSPEIPRIELPKRNVESSTGRKFPTDDQILHASSLSRSLRTSRERMRILELQIREKGTVRQLISQEMFGEDSISSEDTISFESELSPRNSLEEEDPLSEREKYLAKTYEWERQKREIRRLKIQEYQDKKERDLSERRMKRRN